MIIACPACSTKYVVPDTAKRVEGRTVRCAKCRHSWHQDGPELDLSKFEKPAQAPEPTGTTAPDEPAGTAESAKPGFTNTHRTEEEPAHSAEAEATPTVESESETPSDDSEEVAAPPPTVVETEPESAPEPETFYYDETSQFDYEPPFRSRRNPLKIWTAAAVLFAVAALGTIAAGSFYGWPEWMPVSKPTFAVSQPDLVLYFPADQQDRNTSPDGSEYFGAKGTITNTGRETRTIPSILIVMRDERNQLVYSWEVVPPQETLAPGEKITVNEAVNNIPKRAKFAEIGWKPS
jgi:predicted Zn finger-like uncharacterized protein